MFAMKSVFLLAIVALCNFVLATPPGCLLAAVNTLDHPADLDVACGDKSKDVQQEITKVCDDDKVDAALKAFQKSCSEAGHDIKLIPTSTSGGKNSATGTSSPTGFQTSSAPSGTASSSGSASGSGSTPSPTDSGSISMTQQADSLAVAAVVAMLGFVAAI